MWGRIVDVDVAIGMSEILIKRCEKLRPGELKERNRQITKSVSKGSITEISFLNSS